MLRDQGRHKSDAEKRAAGTLRADNSDAARAGRISAEIYRFPIMREIPDPEATLDDVGLLTYFRYAEILQRAGKLTAVTQELCTQIAINKQEQQRRLRKGDSVPAYVGDKIAKMIGQLGIVEDAAPISPLQEEAASENRFARCGAANRASQARRIQESRAD